MTEVRVHAAFSVKDETLFLSEAKKMITETQVRQQDKYQLNKLCVMFFVQKEKGCIHYQLYKEKGKVKSYAMIETWETAEVSDI